MCKLAAMRKTTLRDEKHLETNLSAATDLFANTFTVTSPLHEHACNSRQWWSRF